MKKTIRLTESELHNLIKESVKSVLNEYGGWTQDPMEWGVVNTSQDGRNIYKVGLWWGSGYALDIYLAWANSDEEALNYVVAYITNHHPKDIETADRYAEETIQDIMKEKGCDREEAQESPEFYESFMYVDATMEGATHACYIWSQNLTITKAPEEWKQKFLAREQNSNVSGNEMNESMGRKTIRLTESDLRGLITKILNEEYIDPEGYLDNPNTGDPFGDYRDEIVNDYNGDERAAENDYSWGLNQGDYPSTLPNYRINRNGVNRDINDIHTMHNRDKEWSPRQLRSADRMKDKWIKGERGLDDIDDAFYGSSLNEAVTRAIRKYLK